jgi:hypothetical protein
MQPIAVWAKDGQEWALVHRCTRCAVLTTNRIGPDDNPAALMALAARPLAEPPFPLDAIGAPVS